MSWSYSVNPVLKAEFDAAVDAAVATGQSLDLPGVAEDVAASKAAVKALAGRVKRAKVGGSGSGHCLQESDRKGFSDSLGAQVYGSD